MNKFIKKYNKTKYLMISILIIGMVVFLISDYTNKNKIEHISYDTFIKMLNSKEEINKIYINNKIIIELKYDKNSSNYRKVLFTEKIEPNANVVARLEKADVSFTGGMYEENPAYAFVLKRIIPIIVPIIAFIFLLKGLSKNRKLSHSVMSFGRKTGKIYGENETGISFDDVAGQDEAKESLKEIVTFLNNPDKYIEIGARLPKGALLVGPPGTGKTLLAKAVAGEAGVPFFSISGSAFVEMFVGMGAARVRDLFSQAQEKAPCIIFIDEIDAIGKSREISSVGNDEREQTLNQLLSEMDGFDSSKGVVILAATNRPEILDKALLRPGRFDRRVIVDKPDLKGREEIIKVHIKNVKTDAKINITPIAKATSGAVGADLANIVNEAALMAVKENRKFVSQEDLEMAIELIIAGKEKKDKILSDSDKEIIAFHEVGHGLASAMLKSTDPVHKITIVPRTVGSLGYTMQMPTQEKILLTKEEMLDKITVLLAGRAAEEVKFKKLSTGASNDIETATEMARRMVTVYGMTEKFDLMTLEYKNNTYLDSTTTLNCSAETSYLVDSEVLEIIKYCHKRAIDILEQNKELMCKIVSVLLEKETMSGVEFFKIIKEFEK